jgi:DNA-binding beta-propeller fold protein YncE
VISGRTSTVIATITVGRDPESVAASSRTGTAYVADIRCEHRIGARSLPGLNRSSLRPLRGTPPG